MLREKDVVVADEKALATLMNNYFQYNNRFRLKRATKSYFTHYSSVAIILFNAGLCRSACSTISFRTLLVFRLSLLSGFFCFELNDLNQDIQICVSSSFNDTHMEQLDSVQKFIETQGWLLLTFLICLLNQLSSFNSIIVQMSEKRDSSSK